MSDYTRREAIQSVAISGALSAAPNGDTPNQEPKDAQKADRQRVIACGMTEAEADCWEAVAQAAGKFFALPKLHSMDDHEVSHAIHILQHKLLSRPVYRKYLELAKEGK